MLLALPVLLRMDDTTDHIAVGLRLGAPPSVSHISTPTVSLTSTTSWLELSSE